MKKILFWIIVGINIFILINTITAQSYFLEKTNKLAGGIISNKKDIGEKTFGVLINIVVSVLSIKQIGSVSADEILGCCPKTNEGAVCQDSIIGATNCAETPIPTSCSQVAECQIGCCISPDQGLCDIGSPMGTCENSGGDWNSEPNCLIQECQKGCCIIGSQAVFTNEKRCNVLSQMYGLQQKDFRDLSTEIECLVSVGSLEKGACVYEDSTSSSCLFTTETDCRSSGGYFHKNKLCSNIILETDCTRQATTGCLDGSDEIYWFDSCGNTENIYSSDKDASWNNGMILSKSESCNPSDSNIGSEICGNCDRLAGSICSASNSGTPKIQDGNFYCKSLKCLDNKGKIRENGESWCSYDSYIGDGKDTVGSRHWLQMCDNGEIITEGCADYRGQICAEVGIPNPNTEQTFTIAQCIMNEASVCLGYNSGKTDIEKRDNCVGNVQCVWKNIDVDDYFKFDMCVPQYPRGFEQRERNSVADDVCELASQTCTAIYVKNYRGKLVCKENCDCEDPEFFEKMNDFCISLGDCGTSVNYIGKGTDNTVVSGAPEGTWESYVQYSQADPTQKANFQYFNRTSAMISGTALNGEYQPDGFDKVAGMIGTVSGATGTSVAALATVAVIAGTDTTIASVLKVFSAFSTAKGGVYVNSPGNPAFLNTILPSIGSMATVFSCVAIGAMLGSWLAGEMGLVGSGALAMTVAGALIGLGAGIGFGFTWTAGTSLFGGLIGLGPVGIIAGVLLAVYTWIVGWGKTKEKKVIFECKAWEAPTGGSDCHKCNEGPEGEICSKYKCESLGQACYIINENTNNPTCEAIEDNKRPPLISPGVSVNNSISFENEQQNSVSIRMANGECIREFYPAIFTLETDEIAQCKYSIGGSNVLNYNEMQSYPAEGTMYGMTHTFGIFMPSLDALWVYNVSGDIREMLGNMRMYVTCQDTFGYINPLPYVVDFCINTGPDLTPAYPTKTTPTDESYFSYNQTTIPVSIYLNEPAECKYSFIEGGYENLEFPLACKTEITDYEKYGWPCYANISIPSNRDFDIYYKCKDQPWFKNTINESQRNINTESFVLSLKASSSSLLINSISPSGTIYAGYEPYPVQLQVETSGGAEQGKSICYYSFNKDNPNWILFKETFSNEHTQVFSTMMNGHYNILIKCEDAGGNIANDMADFWLDIDDNPPVITRMYQSSGQLVVETDEDALCYYSNLNCLIDFDSAESMSTSFSDIHRVEWNPEIKYYIKCEDVWHNFGDGCTAIIQPGQFN